MAGEKYVVAAGENPLQISIRNILNPCGYTFLGNCSDAVSLLRLVRSYDPDFIVADLNIPMLRHVIETVDDELLCACILIGEYKNIELSNLMDKSKAVFFCPKPINRDIFINTIELANINYKRISELNKKLKEMTENYETRRVVEKAKWILIERDGMSENDAYERMRKKSMDTRTTIKEIAEAVIFTHELKNRKG